MTFLEAAIAILQREGRPLHYRKLTEIALKDNLLTVVGRTPEATMQQRLNDALKKEDGTGLLVRDKPGVFGLRYYAPPEPAPAPAQAPEIAAAVAPTPTAPAATSPTPARTEPAGDKPEGERKRRRRGGRGRRRRGDGGTTQPDLLPVGALHPGGDAGDDADDGLEGDEPAGGALSASDPDSDEPPPLPPPPTALVPAVAAEPNRPTSSPSDRLPGQPEVRSFAEAAAVVAAAHRRRAGLPEIAPPPPSPPSEVAAAPAPAPGPAAFDEPVADRPDDLGLGLGDDEDFDHPSGPLIAPAFGTEELVRGEEHREPIDRRDRAVRGRERHRDRKGRGRGEGGRAEAGRGEGGRTDGGQRRQAAPSASPPPAAPAPAAAPAAAAAPPRPAEVRAGAEMLPIDAAIEILRGSDGRPIHVRQIVEMALKRRLLRGELPELIRLVRGAIVVDAREREAGGQRPRVRAAGGSSYQLADRRLEPELAQGERELGERAGRLSEATRQSLLKRLGKLPPHAFEALMRLLMGRLGLSAIELVKRGEGVAYFGGEREGPAIEGRRRRVLVGLRPGEAELSRRSVGELRAGLKARGYDEGLLLAAGRIGADALAELGVAGGAVAVHDADELASLCLRHGVGVMRRTVPVDVLDVDLLGDLAET